LFICLVQYFCGHTCVCPSIRCDNVSAARQAGSLLKRPSFRCPGTGRDISGPPSTCLGTRTRSICRAWVRPHSAGAPQPTGTGCGMRSLIRQDTLHHTGTSTDSQPILPTLIAWYWPGVSPVDKTIVCVLPPLGQAGRQ
jgi:hypothetical protein